MDNRYSLFVGRYQPFHNGHRWLIEQRLKLGKKVCIGIMDIPPTEPEKNPYKVEEVYENISLKLKDLIDEEKVKLIILPPIESINYGRTVGYDVIEHTPPNNIKEISATKIRKSLKL